MKTFAGLKQELNNRQKVCIGDIFTDNKTRRIHIMFAEKPCQQMRQTLKAHGFGWYPKQGTWSKNWSAKDEKFARTFVRQCNHVDNVANKTNKTVIIDFPKSNAPKKSVAELEQTKTVKAVADTVKTTPKAVKKQVKEVKAVKTVKTAPKTNIKKANAITERDGIKIGDIFAESCGYSMTYYHFYRVIGFKGQKTVIFAPICKKTVSGDAMCGEVVPVIDKFAYNRYNICGTIEKIVKTGGENPTFKGKEYFFRHREGRKYFENHLD